MLFRFFKITMRLDGAPHDVQRGAGSPQGMVGLRIGAVPNRQHGIAHEFIQGALLVKDGLRRQSQVVVEHAEDRLRIMLFAIGGETR